MIHADTPKNLHISTIFKCYTGYRFSVDLRHICLSTASSRVRFFCFNALFTSPSHVISGLSLFFFFFLIPATRSTFIQAICHLPCVICLRHFKPLFSILFRTESLPFLLLLNILLLIMGALAALFQISVPALKSFVLNL